MGQPHSLWIQHLPTRNGGHTEELAQSYEGGLKDISQFSLLWKAITKWIMLRGWTDSGENVSMYLIPGKLLHQSDYVLH